MPTLSLALRRAFQRLSLCSRGSLNHTSELEANNTLGYDRCAVCGEQRYPFCDCATSAFLATQANQTL